MWNPQGELVLRDRDTDGNGTLDERLWVQQDSRGDVTALVNDVAAVVERFVYDPYGKAMVLTASWAVRPLGSQYDWQYLYRGSRFDAQTGLYLLGGSDYSPTLGREVERPPQGALPSGTVPGQPPFGADQTFFARSVPERRKIEDRGVLGEAWEDYKNYFTEELPGEAEGGWKAAPVYGSGSDAVASFADGRICRGLYSSGMTVLDVFMVKSAAQFAGRQALRLLPRGISSSSGTIERSGLRILAPFEPRTPNLPQSASMAEVLENGWLPQIKGITLTDRGVRFADMYKLTKMTGAEYGLSKEIVRGKAVYRLYSGGADAVQIGGGGYKVVRVIGHTHPSGFRFPSAADTKNINRFFLKAIGTDPLAPVPGRVIIWGTNAGETTRYFPNVLR